jgi:hypothetical protein
MSKIQPGSGYGFISSGYGYSINVGQPFEGVGDVIASAWLPVDNGDDTFSMYPGTINSTIPCIGTNGPTKLLTSVTSPTPRASYNFDGTGTCYIYLRAGAQISGSVIVWPSPDFNTAAYPLINGYATKQNDSDTYGHILLAIAQKDPSAPASPSPAVRFTRFVTNSIWSERHKYTQPNSAVYKFFRV